MNLAELGTGARWRYALKPASWPKLLVPTLLGQVLGVQAAGALSWPGLLLGVVFTLALGTFIVLMNDWGDREVDAIKRRMFPDGGSPKTIPDGILPAPALLRMGGAAGLGAVLVAYLLGVWIERPWLGWLGLLCVLTFVAYSLPPLALNYRGGGEALEALGVGLLLPLFHGHAQAGVFWAAEWWVLTGFVALSLASALASGLSDEASDRVGGKRTLATQAGNAVTRRSTEALVLLGAGLWLLAGLWMPAIALWAMVPGVLAVLGFSTGMFRISSRATTGAFQAQGEYKQWLHRAIWSGALLVAAGLLAADIGADR
ncbi:MAG: prenyltransferase [Gammaproteobacteria bacterium]|nr:prenyltransferase [Gammaproteobacteria bacterium]